MEATNKLQQDGIKEYVCNMTPEDQIVVCNALPIDLIVQRISLEMKRYAALTSRLNQLTSIPNLSEPELEKVKSMRALSDLTIFPESCKPLNAQFSNNINRKENGDA